MSISHATSETAASTTAHTHPNNLVQVTPLCTKATAILPYHPDLTPTPSPLCPHYPARDCLQLWCPDLSTGTTITSEAHLECILQVIDASWQDSTKATYGSGLLVFHIFCDQQNIPELAHCPAPTQLVLAFLSSCAGAYTGTTLANYVAGLKACHILHGQPWLVDADSLKCCLEGANHMAPLSFKCPLRAPFTPEIITSIKSLLQLEEPLDAAIFACMSVCFWCMVCLGKFTVPNLKAFNLSKNITHAAVTSVCD
ncbi:hypothetical protein ID866_12134 [Astraeus odoratus]|nr:hypothetical protein ID866_12134 [Astraeus odoratus]